jgi:hypothetical protein
VHLVGIIIGTVWLPKIVTLYCLVTLLFYINWLYYLNFFKLC